MKNIKLFRNVTSNIIIGCILLGVLMFGIYSQSSASVMVSQPIYSGDSKDKVSLMVNVYWGTEFIDDMLEIFAKHNTHTTFFVGGSWVKNNEDVLKKIHNSGHEIANHGYFHSQHDKLDEKGNRQEIMATHNLVKALIGVDMNLFAPPSGAYNKLTVDTASNLGYTTIMWSLDTIDWRDKDKNKVFSRATSRIKGGDLVLMHPTKHTTLALDDILTQIENKGLSVCPVSDVIQNNL